MMNAPEGRWRRCRGGLTLAVLLLVIGAGVLRYAAEDWRRHQCLVRRFPIMGTVAAFTLYGEPERIEEAADAALSEFEQVVKLCNLYDPESELSQLNRTAATAAFSCSEELWTLLTEARRAYELSDGAFDISAKPLMDLWGFYRRRGDAPPTAEEIRETCAKVGLEKVRFDEAERSVFFTVPGMAFDLGGIAKGYAVDRAAEAVITAGVRRGVIDLGGNLRLLPEPPPGAECYRVGVRDPEKRDAVLPEILEVVDISISTSGDYERFVTLGEHRYGHIMNPLTGVPSPGKWAVTVLAPSALAADWMSTAVFICGEPLAEELEEKFPDVEILIRTVNGGR